MTGHLAEATVVTGSVVPVGSVLAVLEVGSSEGGQSADSVATPFPPAAVEVAATPGARRFAGQLGIDLADVGVAAGGEVIREDDVRNCAHARGHATDPEEGPGRKEPLDGAADAGLHDRSVVAARLTRAAAVPTVTNVDEADFGAVQSSGVSPLTALAFVVSRTLLEQPRCNMLAPQRTPGPPGVGAPRDRHPDRDRLGGPGGPPRRDPGSGRVGRGHP